MKRMLWLAAWLHLSLALSAQFVPTDTLKFRIRLTDKHATRYSLQEPERYLSAASIARRQRQGLPIDSTDLPVCGSYVEEIRRHGVHIALTGKWENFVTVSCNDSTPLGDIARLPFVRSVERVWRGRMRKATRRDSLTLRSSLSAPTHTPGLAQRQMLRALHLHDAGYRGQGMTVAVIDAGFHNADRIPALQHLRVVGTRDFVYPGADIYAESSHGMSVLSCMAMDSLGGMVGTAPEASYWLLRSEDAFSEHPVEEDYWAAAIEFADSVGVDVVNTSLGYYAFDDAVQNYRLRDLDGRRSLMSRQAAQAAGKGMVLVCSAGNSGAGVWKKITPPADAEDVLTVGAVDRKGIIAPFSSVGYTADGRVKPDVVAIGAATDVMGTNGHLRLADGTSFASPVLCGMVVCLWQARPELTARQVIEVVRRSADRYDYPDNIYGYGIPDFEKALYMEVSAPVAVGEKNKR